MSGKKQAAMKRSKKKTVETTEPGEPQTAAQEQERERVDEGKPQAEPDHRADEDEAHNW